MKYYHAICLSALSGMTVTTTAQDQKTIVISDNLAAIADKLPVKMGTQWAGKIWKFKFGDYSVGESKASWVTTGTKGGMFNRKTESTSKQKFYFELKGPGADVAHVNASTKIETEALREFVISEHIEVGDELLLEKNSLSAFIRVNDDTTEIWTLVMTTYSGSQTGGENKPVAFLSNSKRTLFFVPVNSNKNGNDKRNIPALGYELIENNVSLAALQFYGGGAMGLNKNIIWLPRDVEPGLRLVLAAALTAVLQKKVDNMSF